MTHQLIASSFVQHFRKVQRIFDNIKHAIKDMIEPTNSNSTGIRKEMVRNILRKVEALRLKIEWPSPPKDKQLDKRYKNIKIRKSKYLLRTVSQLSKLSRADNVEEVENAGFPKYNVRTLFLFFSY